MLILPMIFLLFMNTESLNWWARWLHLVPQAYLNPWLIVPTLMGNMWAVRNRAVCKQGHMVVCACVQCTTQSSTHPILTHSFSLKGQWDLGAAYRKKMKWLLHWYIYCSFGISFKEHCIFSLYSKLTVEAVQVPSQCFSPDGTANSLWWLHLV